MQNFNSPSHTKIISFYDNRRSGRWYVTEDKRMKIRLDDDRLASVIINSLDSYSVLDNIIVDNKRQNRPISPKVTLHADVMQAVANAREIDAKLAAKRAAAK